MQEKLSSEPPASRSRMRFSPKLERTYRQYIVQTHSRPAALNWLVGILVQDLFLINDYIVAPRDILLYAFGRLGCVTPLCLLAVGIALRRRRVSELALCIPQLIMAVVLSSLIIETHGACRTSYLFGNVLLMMCGSVISRSRVRLAIWTVAIQCACFVIVVFVSDAVTPNSILVSIMFCVGGAIMSLLASAALERSSRDAFLMNTRIRRLNRELESAAMTDPLTGLANRRCLGLATERLWEARDNPAREVSFILIDVDFFKAFNDNYGHAAGDRCLTTIAAQVRSALRGGDDLAVRFGGEELLVVLPDRSLAHAQSIAERIRLQIMQACVPHPVLGAGAVVTASLGVATASTRLCTALELASHADLALYAAKAAGRNRVWPAAGPDKMDASPEPGAALMHKCAGLAAQPR